MHISLLAVACAISCVAGTAQNDNELVIWIRHLQPQGTHLAECVQQSDRKLMKNLTVNSFRTLFKVKRASLGLRQKHQHYMSSYERHVARYVDNMKVHMQELRKVSKQRNWNLVKIQLIAMVMEFTDMERRIHQIAKGYSSQKKAYVHQSLHPIIHEHYRNIFRAYKTYIKSLVQCSEDMLKTLVEARHQDTTPHSISPISSEMPTDVVKDVHMAPEEPVNSVNMVTPAVANN